MSQDLFINKNKFINEGVCGVGVGGRGVSRAVGTRKGEYYKSTAFKTFPL